jgi:DNA-binding NarL/FixJ family response regulator
MEPIKVVIADDQALLREALTVILEKSSDFKVVGTAADGLEVLELCEKTKPDLVLMDIRMPQYDGIYATQQLKLRYPGIKVLILSTFDDDASVYGAIKHGASGYLLKDIEPQKLREEIKRVMAGGAVLHQDVVATVVQQLAKHARSEDEHADLTDRERTIINMVVKGKNNREIADELHLSEGTVKNMLSAIYARLNVADRTQLVVYAIQNHLVKMDAAQQ